MDSTPENTGLSAREYERQKTAEGRVEDIAYTINHSIVCTAVDIVGAQLSKATEQKVAGQSSFWSWFFGEIIGDYVAVPLTVGVQRFAPGLMGGIRSLMEPLLAPLFRFGAQRSAKRWAEKNGIAADDPKVAEHAKDIYEHEVRHLPQALMWTLTSSGVNIGVQYGIERTGAFGPKVGGTLRNWLWGKSVGKIVASGLTAGGVVLFRGVTPNTAEQVDHWTSKNIFLPMTESIGHLFGVKREDVERLAKKKEAEARGEVVNHVQLDGRISEGPDRTVG